MAHSERRLSKTVVLVGMMGSGKTAIGKHLASKLRVPFVDSDAEIEKAANASIAEIFERDGETFFRDRETEVITRLLTDRPTVLSTGGGAFLSARNRKLISQHGVSLWLNVDLDILWERVRHKNTRPLLRTDDPFETLRSLNDARRSTYALADLSVSTEAGFSIDQTTNLVLEALAARPDVLEVVR